MKKSKLLITSLVVVSIGYVVDVSQVYGQKSAPSSSTANVKVVNTSSEPVPVTGTVNIGNLGNSTLAVRDVDNPARQPVQATAACGAGQIGCPATIYTVPAGKRLVIEYVTADVETQASGSVAFLEIATTAGGSRFSHFLTSTAPTVLFAGLSEASIRTSQQVRLYADPETVVKMGGYVNTGGINYFSFTISGYLVDIP